MNINIKKLQSTKFSLLTQNLLTLLPILCLYLDLVCPCLLPEPLPQAPPWSSCSPPTLTVCFPYATRVPQARSQLPLWKGSEAFQSSMSLRIKAKVLTIAHKAPHSQPPCLLLCSHLPCSPAHFDPTTLLAASPTLHTAPASGPLHPQSSLPGTLSQIGAPLSLTSLSSLIKSHLIHSMTTL